MLNPCTALTVTTPLWESVEPYGMAVLTYPRPHGGDIKILRRSNAGGDTTGYQIPFTLHYTGVKTKGTFNPTTKAFTATSEA